MVSRPLRVCLVALNAYPAVNPSSGGQVGGTETRAWLFARHLARRKEFEVSLAVRTTGPVPQPVVEGVRIVAMSDRFYRVREAVGSFASRRSSFPWIDIHRWSPQLMWQIPLLATARLFEPRPTDPRQPMRFFEEIPADLFCCFGNQSTAATAIASAHATMRPAVLFLGSDDDLNSTYTADSQVLNPYGDTGATCHYSLMHADEIWTQTAEQSQRLTERFGRDSVVIPNPIDLVEWDAGSSEGLSDELASGLDRFVLWVGRAETIHKRPQLLLELAKLTPQIDYLMVLNPRDPAVDASIRRGAPANVKIVTRVPFSKMRALMGRATAYVNTSSLEGFPNVFLQAAASQRPIVSLEVGESFLSHSGAGVYVGKDLSQAAAALNRFWGDASAGQECGLRGRRFVEQYHSAEAVVERFADEIRRCRQR